ncbi:MAG: HepT-like ribonuclease domain-containing protein [Nanoarchaeota archaeon]
MREKDDDVFIEHIMESIAAIKDFSKNMSKEELMKNRLKRSAIVREIEIIGEAVKNISDDLKKRYRKVGWGNIARTRDKMIHHYFGIDVEIVWGILTKDIFILEGQMKEIKKKLSKK